MVRATVFSCGTETRAAGCAATSTLLLHPGGEA